MNKKIKFAVVGFGHIGKRHADLIAKNADAELAAICDIKQKELLRLENYAVPFYQSIEDLLHSGIAVDVINIATPNSLHASQALQCLAHNKHVVVEKPLSLKKSDAEEIVFKALQVHKHVFAVMQNRYSPPSAWLKEMVSSGILGKIFLVQINCFWNRDERYYVKNSWHGSKEQDGGTLFTQFSHFIDLMYWVFGDIENIKARMASFNHKELTQFEDSGYALFDFKNGGMGNLSFSTSVWDKNLESSMTIIAENGSIKVGGQYMDKVEYCHVKNYEMPQLKPTNPGNDYGAYKGSAANHHFVIDNVVEVLNNKSFVPNLLDAVKSVEIIERIYSGVEKLSKCV